VNQMEANHFCSPGQWPASMMLACLLFLAPATGAYGAADQLGGLIADLGHADDTVQGKAVYALVDIGARAVAPLIACLKSSDPHVRAGAADALGRIEDARAVPSLIAALKDTDYAVQRKAASGLGYIGDARAVEPLAAILREPDPGAGSVSRGVMSLRTLVVIALGEIENSRAVASLIAALEDDKDREVRVRAAGALGEFKDPRAVVPLTAALKDTDPRVRADAAVALIDAKDVRAVVPLIGALKDDDSGVRDMAAEALGRMRGSSAVMSLIAALKDADPEVRKQAARALGEIKDPRGETDPSRSEPKTGKGAA
jgi:HEAT repeat protein